MNTCLRFVGAGALAAAVVLGQGVDSRSGFPVQGEISSATPFVGSMTVELSSDGAGPPETAVVHPDGTFEFRSVQPGAHELRVIGPGGAVIHQETVFIARGGHSLSVRLPAPPPTAGPASGGTISLQQLGHKISPTARKAFDRGAKALAKQDYGQAAESFRQAVAIDPEFADAHNELGVAQAAVGDLPDAVESFQKAVDLVPEHGMALSNLSIALAKLRRFHEAAVVARRALKIVPGSGRIRYILAASILFESGGTDEALYNFERATPEVPRAHLAVADILAERGQRDEAIHHLEEYLQASKPDDKERGWAEGRLAELRH